MSDKHIPKLPPKWVLRRIDKCLAYNPKTGDLIWIVSLAPRIKVGDIAGTRHKDGCIQIGFVRNYKAVLVKAHHVAWYKYYGYWPTFELDHKRHRRWDNRIKKLRRSNRSTNNMNRSLAKNNTTGVSGVYYDKSRNKYVAEIMVRQKKIFLGRFYTLREAKRIRRKAERKYFGRWRYKQAA
jgi:hypothetical protein